MLCCSYKCSDRRYYIRESGTAHIPQPSLVGRCEWDSTYSVTPGQLECLVRFCDNATTEPNTSGRKFNLTWSGLVSVETSLDYPCADNHRLEDDTDWKSEARASLSVPCGADGWFDYPAWPQCSEVITVSNYRHLGHSLI